jgi:2-polyprenyl-6-methoxyphenol hydroxylase-like FAD-dependent oxidoreductase
MPDTFLSGGAMDNRDALVVGCGLGGLATAIALRQKSWDVTVLEKQPDLHSSTYGVGIIQPINALRALDMIGCADECLEQGHASEGWARFLDIGGNVVGTAPGARIEGSHLPTMNGITRPALHRIMTNRAIEVGAKIEYSNTFTNLTSDDSGVTAELADGTTRRYDIVVGADGALSDVRAYVIDVKPAYLGQSAFRINIPLEPEIDRITLQGGPNGMCGYVPIGRELAYLFLNITWPDRDRRIPQQEQMRLLRDLLEPYGGLTARVREAYLTEAHADEIVFRPEDWLIADRPWHKGRIVLIGDAVHAVPPHLGQGAAQAIEDGVVLAEELSDQGDVENAFAAYTERRFDRCKLIVDTCVAIGRSEMDQSIEFDHQGATQRVLEEMIKPL